MGPGNLRTSMSQNSVAQLWLRIVRTPKTIGAVTSSTKEGRHQKDEFDFITTFSTMKSKN